MIQNFIPPSCSACRMRQICLPSRLEHNDLNLVDEVITQRTKIAKGELLYRNGDSFAYLYAVRLGHFKTYHIGPTGKSQITNFLMAGELIGLDAIANNIHMGYAEAIEDSEVCRIKIDDLNKLIAKVPLLRSHFHHLMSSEIIRMHKMMTLLTMDSNRKLSIFLINLSEKYVERGQSATSFQFRMSREDISDHLGLTIESISRVITKFKKLNLIEVDNRNILIKDLPALKEMALIKN